MTARFTTGLLTGRSGRDHDDTKNDCLGMRDEETGKVYAFPAFQPGGPHELFVRDTANDLNDRAPELTGPELEQWDPELEPFTFTPSDGQEAQK